MAVQLREPVVIGRISGVFGVRGWLKVHSYTEPMDNFLNYPECFIRRQGQWQLLPVTAGKAQGKGLVIKVDGVDTPEAGRAYNGCDLAVEAAALPALAEDEFYWHQLEGLQVVTDHPQRGMLRLGRVDHLLETGANDVLVVRGDEHSIDRRERLIPYLPGQVVQEVDTAGGTIRVDWDPDF